jgi:hypothetical protein
MRTSAAALDARYPLRGPAIKEMKPVMMMARTDERTMMMIKKMKMVKKEKI